MQVPADGPGAVLKVGENVAGEITTASHLNYSDGSRSQAFTFDLKRGQAVRIEAKAGYCGRLTLFDAGLNEVVREATCGSETEQHQVTRLTMVATEAQRYTVAFGGHGSAEYGPFVLSLRAVELRGSSSEVNPGDEIDGVLVNEVEAHSLRITQAGAYQVDLRSSEFDAKLVLQGRGVEREDDDGGDGRDARIVAYLMPGVYRLTAEALGDEAGYYQLSVNAHRVAIPAGTRLQHGGELALDDSPVAGLLRNQEARYQLTLIERAQVTLDLKSEYFDTKLWLDGPDVRLSDDDGGDGKNARIVTVLDPGTYTLRVADLDEGNAGLFTLVARSAAAPAPPPILVPEASHQGDLVAGGKDRYRLFVPAAGTYVIRMESDELDSYVSVLRNGELLADDDGGDDEGDARLEIKLAPGEYALVAEGFSAGSGPYRIMVNAR